jgi:hypothetical protein
MILLSCVAFKWPKYQLDLGLPHKRELAKLRRQELIERAHVAASEDSFSVATIDCHVVPNVLSKLLLVELRLYPLDELAVGDDISNVMPEE